MRGLVGFRTKTIRKRVKIEKVAFIGMVQWDFLQKPLKNGPKLKRRLRFAWFVRVLRVVRVCFPLRGLVGFRKKSYSKTSQNRKDCFNFRGLVGFHIKTIQEQVKIQKVA